MQSVTTPASRALLAMSRPSGFSVNRDTHAACRPSRARPTAVFSSAPPISTSSEYACSNRRLSAGVSRTIASPKVMTSMGFGDGGPAPAGLPHDINILRGQRLQPVKLPGRAQFRVHELAADAKTAGSGLEEVGGSR